jgi:hypothetical protein
MFFATPEAGSTKGRNVMRHTAIVILAVCLLAAIVSIASADPVQWAGNGHWYETVEPSGGLTCEEAGLAAQGRMWMGMPGHLATITSQEEQDFIATLLGTANCWLAGYQDPTSGAPADNWHWQTAETWSYTNWQPGEPNDYYGAEHCLTIYSFGKWNDSRCIEQSSYLVEYDGLASVESTTWGGIKALFGLSSK